MKTTFIDAEYVGGAALATLLNSIYEDNPDVTLDWVQEELAEFAGIIADYQEEYGENAPLSLIA